MKTKYSTGEYIIYSSEFDCGVFLLETDEQLKQAELDSNVSKFKGSEAEAKEIIDLMFILIRLEDSDDNTQRIELLRNNIKMMCSKHI